MASASNAQALVDSKNENTKNDESVAEALQTLNQLVNVFQFPFDLASRAVNAIAVKSDVSLAYNYCLDHGGFDTGGPVVPLEFCPHLRHHEINLQKLPYFVQKGQLNQCQHEQCSEEKSDENWICIGQGCGKILCSRYFRSHALEHYENEDMNNQGHKHCIAIGTADLSVWCYKCNSYLKHDSLNKALHELEKIKFGGDCIKSIESLPINTGIVFNSSDVFDAYQSPCQNSFDRILDAGLASKCLAIGGKTDGIQYLVDVVIDSSSSISNGIILLDDMRDPFTDSDCIYTASKHAFISSERVLVVNWGLFEGSGKRIWSDDDAFEEIQELSDSCISLDGIRSISCPYDVSDKSQNIAFDCARNWNPQLILVRAGFWQSSITDPESLLARCDIFLNRIKQVSKCGLILALSIGSRPSLGKDELKISSESCAYIVDQFIASGIN